jgi:large subunit ribosomal protein L40e
MKVLVRLFEDNLLELQSSESIESIKQQIETLKGIPQDIQRLTFNSSELETTEGLEEGSVLDLHLALLGGAVSTDVPDHLKELAHKYRTYKMICRKCYARLPLNAHNCRKRKCGHCPNIRPKKKIKDKEGKK